MAGGGWQVGVGLSQPAWLDQAELLAHNVDTRGVGFLRGLEPAGDPRVGPAALLLLLGLPVTWMPALAHLGGILLAALAFPLLAARHGENGSRSGVAGAWFLAAAPLWAEAALAAEPHLLVGLLFLVLGRPIGNRWLRVACLGWVLGWSPWAWISVIILPLGTLLRSSGGRGRGPTDILLALAALWLLNPPALLDPGGWVAGMLREAQIQRVWGGGGQFGVRPGLLPLTGTLHVTGLVLLLYSGRTWARRLREGGDLAPLVGLVLLLTGARSGFADRAVLTVLLPWAAAEVGTACSDLCARSGRICGVWRGRLAVLLLILPLLNVGYGRWQGRGREAAAGPRATAWLEEQLPAGSLVVHDLGFAPPDSTGLIWLAVPFHGLEPQRYRGAYWVGWYRSAAAFVLSERMVARFLRERQASREMLAFYARLAEEARRGRERTFGEEPGQRTRIVVPGRQGESPLGEGWRRRLTDGARGGLPGGFLASLGGALTSAGFPGEAAELLEECRLAGYRELGISLNLANALLALGRTMEAGQVLDEARTRYPDSRELRYNLGLVLTRAGLWERATRTLMQLRSDWPGSASVAYLLGLALANSGRRDDARREVERALEMDADFPERRSAEELMELLQDEGR
jgi:tetratricopeptide (TPR) repeat protein